MTDRPILFSAPMVRALLDGSKTQTRRVLNPQPVGIEGCFKPISSYQPVGVDKATGKKVWEAKGHGGKPAKIASQNPLVMTINTDDRLWVRENWSTFADTGRRAKLSDVDLSHKDINEVIHIATANAAQIGIANNRPSIFMPRWASRLTLEVTDVRVQRLNDISGNDAKAEGVESALLNGNNLGPSGSYKDNFKNLWNNINGTPRKRSDGSNGTDLSWEANPWGVAYTFKVIEQNIDQIGGAA